MASIPAVLMGGAAALLAGQRTVGADAIFFRNDKQMFYIPEQSSLHRRQRVASGSAFPDVGGEAASAMISDFSAQQMLHLLPFRIKVFANLLALLQGRPFAHKPSQHAISKKKSMHHASALAI